MVVSFGRTSFKINEESTTLALESAIGVKTSSLQVSSIGERVFPFLVSCKNVGLFILHQMNFICHASGDGGCGESPPHGPVCNFLSF